MKIWITEIGEPLPLEQNVRLHRYGEFSKYLAAKGHDVTWWTSTFSHAPKKFLLTEDKIVNCDGVNVRFLHGPGYRRNVSFARIKHQAHFADRFYNIARDESSPDLIISPIPTIDVAKKAIQIGLEKNIPVVTDIRDRWPDEIVNMAPEFLRPLVRIGFKKSYADMSFVCKNAAGIMGVSNYELNYGLKFAKREKNNRDYVFHHGYSPKKVEESEQQKTQIWLKENKIRTDVFTCCFFGTIGRYFDLEKVIKAVSILEKNHDIQVIIAGTGSSLNKYKKMAKGMENIIFPGWLDFPKISAIMSISSVGLAPYVLNSVFSMPNKPFEYMSAGLPIISSITGELSVILSKFNCGMTYDGTDAASLATAIGKLIENPDLQKEMGRNSQSLFDNEFSTQIIFKKTEEYLRGIVSTK